MDIDGAPHAWSAVLSYDYSMANASDNLADIREDDLHICKLLEFPLRGSDGNAILGKLSIKRGRKLSTWFGAFRGC